MDFWTFIAIVVFSVILSNVRNKVDIALQVNKVREATKKEIDDLNQRVNELEKRPKKGIEKRLQAIETIVVDDDYHLTMKFKELLNDENNENRNLYNL
ncbi:MAG: hypothetical protein PVG39_09665 [Desulfobacteraceae bacterium]|jgi:hypothetical protein